ncbi:DUF1801 domain-containing protein [Frondihabitans australicus]|uniref:YdhG-like domain-containing protein n=1 Tax=Frondihabitans australicus TaxID=386892 RepID=A0A495IDE6_9MICO|nr:DUF1801 domain-containing protein [Frondihabitans australicus]RKR73036.1 hypothetical protein C8E83_0118 [Frondihabitans australicus]
MTEIPAEVGAVLEGAPPARRADAAALLDLFADITGQEPWLPYAGIIGFGHYDYEYASGHSGSSAAAAFGVRTTGLVVYLMDGCATYEKQLARLGPHRTTTGCLYLKRLDGVDLGVLREIVAASYAALTAGVYRHRASDAGGGETPSS